MRAFIAPPALFVLIALVALHAMVPMRLVGLPDAIAAGRETHRLR